MATERKIFENILLRIHKALSFHIWYVASPNDPLPSFSNYDPRAKNGPALGLISFSLENLKKSSSLKPLSLDLSYLVCSIT